MNKVKPFLRWAGGKNWFVNHIDQYLPEKFNNYFEPFLGGGSIFFYLQPNRKCFLSDINFDLINTYIEIRDNPYKVISELKSYINDKDFYYELREKKLRAEYKKAAKFIFLNKTSFNGIYRVNQRGVYNVPYGNKKFSIDEESIIAVSKTLSKVSLECLDFDASLSRIKKGDLAFIDPPYTVAHENNGFIRYNQKLFSFEDQVRLSNAIEFVSKKGAYYILTNAAHPSIKEIYQNSEHIFELKRYNLIGGNGAARNFVSEYIFTNCIK